MDVMSLCHIIFLRVAAFNHKAVALYIQDSMYFSTWLYIVYLFIFVKCSIRKIKLLHFLSVWQQTAAANIFRALCAVFCSKVLSKPWMPISVKVDLIEIGLFKVSIFRAY